MIFVIILMAGIALMEGPPLLRGKNKRHIISYAVIYAFTLAISLLLAAGKELPSPMIILDKLFKSIGLSYK